MSNPTISAYLQYIRQQNAKIASRCHYCNKQSTGINAEGYKVIFVCEEHYFPDNPNVVHRIYQNGREVPKSMMNPNIGGYIRKKENNE